MRFFAIFIIFYLTQSFAIETIKIDKGVLKPFPIAFNLPEVEHKLDIGVLNKILTVTQNNLESSGLFNAVEPKAFIDDRIGVRIKPLFNAWRQINAELLLNTYIRRGQGKYEISFALWDTVLERQIYIGQFEFKEKAWRRIAHKISDIIYEKVTGDKGYFNTRILYVSESGQDNKRKKRLAIMDQDGENHKFLTDGKETVLTPRFSPKGDKILYLTFVKQLAKVYIRNLYDGKQFLLGNFSGISFAPCFSPDGNKALMSISKDGNTHIYEINLETRKIKQITFGGNSINTSPSYSPDGRKIVFNSDRDGTRALYIMDQDGQNLKKITASGTYAAPAWSPAGDYIAFTKILGKTFYIGVMNPEGGSERLIANGYLVERPTWAPNGRVLIYAKEFPMSKSKSTRSRLHTVNITGQHEKEIVTPLEASDPDWSHTLD